MITDALNKRTRREAKDWKFVMAVSQLEHCVGSWPLVLPLCRLPSTMTAAVAPIPQMHEPHDSSALARKRRREILSSQRTLAPDLPASSPYDETPSLKKRKISHAEVSEESDDNSDAKPSRKKVVSKKKSKAGGKKPQMKYDPDVPMTKEEAALWRREQRRKRNRESAAASRQRQRDRISELEVEVDDWKTKFDGIMEKIRELEKVTQTSVTEDLMSDIMALPAQSVVSPLSSPNLTPRQSPTASPVASCSLIDAGKIKAESDLQVHQVEVEESEEQLFNKMISRPA